MSKTPILFLDFDGVIIDSGSRIVEGHRQGINRTSLKLVEYLQHQFGFLVVCSSRAHAKRTWEEQWAPLARYDSTLKFYRDDSRDMSWRTYPVRKICKKPHDPTYNYRGWHIYDWLLEHGYDPETDPYVVIDDESDFYPICPSRFVHVANGEHLGGFTFKHYIEARSIWLSLLTQKGDSK